MATDMCHRQCATPTGTYRVCVFVSCTGGRFGNPPSPARTLSQWLVSHGAAECDIVIVSPTGLGRARRCGPSPLPAPARRPSPSDTSGSPRCGLPCSDRQCRNQQRKRFLPARMPRPQVQALLVVGARLVLSWALWCSPLPTAGCCVARADLGNRAPSPRRASQSVKVARKARGCYRLGVAS
jgi:hypothetical protein